MRRERNNNYNFLFRGRFNNTMFYPPSSPTSSSASSSSPGRPSGRSPPTINPTPRPPRPAIPRPFINPTPRPRTMEEVWGLYNVPSSPFHDAPSARKRRPFYLPPQTHPHILPQIQNFVCQEFPSRPLVNDIPPRTVPRNGGPTLFGSPLQRPVTTVLSLNHGGHRSPSPAPVPFVSNARVQASPNPPLSPFEASASSSLLPPLEDRNRDKDEDVRAERKKQRMMNNRESASRSRARRQAYTTELEVEIKRLMADNDRLKREHREMCLATATSIPKRLKYRRRCSSAPL